MQKSEFLLLIGAAARAILALYANTYHTEPVLLEQLPVMQQEVCMMAAEFPQGIQSKLFL